MNGEPAIILRTPTRPLAVLFLEGDGGQVTRIFAVGNPDKLRRLQTTGRN